MIANNKRSVQLNKLTLRAEKVQQKVTRNTGRIIATASTIKEIQITFFEVLFPFISSIILMIPAIKQITTKAATIAIKTKTVKEIKATEITVKATVAIIITATTRGTRESKETRRVKAEIIARKAVATKAIAKAKTIEITATSYLSQSTFSQPLRRVKANKKTPITRITEKNWFRANFFKVLSSFLCLFYFSTPSLYHINIICQCK